MFPLHPSPTKLSKGTSLRVSVVIAVIIVIFFVVAFIFFLFVFLVWLLSKDHIGGYRAIRRVRVEAFWMYAAHAQWYLVAPWQTQRVQ